jgi:hypothetical protein
MKNKMLMLIAALLIPALFGATALFAANAMSGPGTPVIPAPATPGFSVTINIEPDTISAGEPFYLSYEIENKSGNPIRVPAHFFGPGASDGTGLFFSIVDSDRQPLNPICPAANPTPSGAFITVYPGEYHGVRRHKLTDCFVFNKSGEYTVAAQFASSARGQGLWYGSAMSNVVKFKVRESEPMKRSRSADELIAQWLTNYDYATAPEYKKKLLSLGLAAAPAIAAALQTERNLLTVNDLLELLGQLPCRESVEALIQFISTAKNIKFTSNVPEDFSSSILLIETSIRSLEKLSGEKFDSENGDTTSLWLDWAKKNVNTFRYALPETENNRN